MRPNCRGSPAAAGPMLFTRQARLSTPPSTKLTATAAAAAAPRLPVDDFNVFYVELKRRRGTIAP